MKLAMTQTPYTLLLAKRSNFPFGALVPRKANKNSQ
jgi:hypothetical protein